MRTRSVAAALLALGVTACGSAPPASPRFEAIRDGAPAALTEHDRLMRAAVESVSATWTRAFKERNCCFVTPPVQVFSGTAETPCGTMRAGNTPATCRANGVIYLHDDNWRTKAAVMGRQSRMAEYVAVAHEVGHSVQAQAGAHDRLMMQKLASPPREASAINVRYELQADCYAGVWAFDQRARMTAADMADAVRAVALTGDEHRGGAGAGYATDPTNHGLAADRVAWFKRGAARGEPDDCEVAGD